MKTKLYLIRHGATAANLEKPARLQGRSLDGDLAPEGVIQATRTRDLMAGIAIDFFYSSPMRRAVQTAEIVAEPHGKRIQTVPEFIECDVGRWEGMTWKTIEQEDGDDYRRFMADPGSCGYAGGESFGDVGRRVTPIFERLLQEHSGKTLLVVGHHVVNRVYLAGLLGLLPSQARSVSLDNCGVSIVVRKEAEDHLATLNATFHLLDGPT